MKATNKTTAHLLIKANTNSEWDSCEFAIVHISEEWKMEQAKRLEYLEPLKDNYQFQSMNFYDSAIDFFRVDEDDRPNIENLLGDKEWTFVELEKSEQERLTPPESRLDCYRLVFRADGTAHYTAYGKHTSEEFWTKEFSLPHLIEQL
ncbi:MAG: hypothetical protein QHC79_10325 [Pseudosphingobacterium sp.]|nr:hypothetical protein [Pseudosphingobacterium sp.]